MKKVLFPLFACALALTANAQSTLTADVSETTIGTETYKAVTVSIDNSAKLFGIQSNFYNPETATLVSVNGDEVINKTVQNGLGSDVNVYKPAYSAKSNVENTPVFLAYFNVEEKDNLGGKPVAFENGKVYTALYSLESKGTVRIVTADCNELNVDLDAVTGVASINADREANGKYVENNKIVIRKNNKKFNTIGVQVK